MMYFPYILMNKNNTVRVLILAGFNFSGIKAVASTLIHDYANYYSYNEQ